MLLLDSVIAVGYSIMLQCMLALVRLDARKYAHLRQDAVAFGINRLVLRIPICSMVAQTFEARVVQIVVPSRRLGVQDCGHY